MKSSHVGTKHTPDLERGLDANRNDIVDTLLKPHPTMGERKGAKHRIVARVAAQEPYAQPVQARGHVVWNRAYSFQAHGPSYLDPVPDPDALTEAR